MLTSSRNQKLETLVQATTAGGLLYESQNQAVLASMGWMRLIESAREVEEAGMFHSLQKLRK